MDARIIFQPGRKRHGTRIILHASQAAGGLQSQAPRNILALIGSRSSAAMTWLWPTLRQAVISSGNSIPRNRYHTFSAPDAAPRILRI